MNSRIYVDPMWIKFDRDGSSHEPLDYQLVSRPYEMWRHADSKLSSDAGDLDLADAILWLNRTVNQRTKTLFREYDLHAIAQKLGITTTRSHAIMAEIGLIRPVMLRALTVLRNAVEHEDATPPPLQRCQEFSEFVWYFLRSTDAITRMKSLDLDVTAGSGAGGVSLDFEANAQLPLRGRLCIEQVSWTKCNDWTCIELTQKPCIARKMVIFEGHVIGPRESLIQIWRRYLQLDDT